MKCYFMRHGIAVERGVSGADDRARALTPKGIEKMQKAAKGLAALSLAIDCILTSPFERARQTARMVAQPLGLENRIEEIPELAPDRSTKGLLAALRRYGDANAILLVGHEPQLSRTMAFLLCETTRMEIRLKKGGLCCLEIASLAPKAQAVLHWSLAPKHLRRMA